INAALDGLTYYGNLNFSGSDSLSVVTSDLGHTGSGGALTDTDTVSITVTAVNDAPAGTDKTVTTNEDTSYVFTVADFGFTDLNDSPANALAAAKISSLPLAGTLRYDGTAITAAGLEVSAADIAAGKLTFAPAADANGATYASFTFQVRDDGGTPGL